MKQEEVDKYSDELKSCPFCGGKAQIMLFLGRYSVACTNCLACMISFPVDYDEYKDTFDLVERWNTRQGRDTGSVGIRQTSDSIEFTASGDAQHGYEIGITLGKMMMLDYIWKNCLRGNVMTDGVLDILDRASKI